MARIAKTLGLSFVVFATSCGNPSDSAPPGDSSAIELGHEVTVLTAAQANQAVVQSDRVLLPAAGNEALLALKEQSILASDRSTLQGDPSNAYGFLRRVAGVEQLADKVVVHTLPTTLAEVVKRGTATVRVTPDWAAVKAPVIKSGGADSDGPLIDTTWEISLPSMTVPVQVHGKTVDVDLSASLAIEKAYVDFQPSFDLGLQIDWFSVKEFHAIANGSLDAGLTLKLTGSAAWNKSLTDDEPSDELTKLITEAVQKSSGLSKSTSLLSTSIGLPPWMVGPIPVVTDLNIDVDLECSLSVQGSMDLQVGASASSEVSAGIRFKDGKWDPVSSQSFKASMVGPNITLAGGASIECGLKPTFQLRFYGAVGPYLFVDFYEGFDAKFSSSCDGSSAKPSCSAEASHNRGIKGGVGAKVDISVLGVGFEKDIGELQLFDWSKKDTLFSQTLPTCDMGSCQAPTCAKSGVACGGSLSCCDGLVCGYAGSELICQPPVCAGVGDPCGGSVSCCSGLQCVYVGSSLACSN